LLSLLVNFRVLAFIPGNQASNRSDRQQQKDVFCMPETMHRFTQCMAGMRHGGAASNQGCKYQ
jgi:hypothetical protein